jgi:hypothetical protein
MTAIGIDLQPCSVQVAIDDGFGAAHLLSDGHGTVVPTPSEPQSLGTFWEGLLRRAAGHLGVDPKAVPPATLVCSDAQALSVGLALTRAGWREPKVASATVALIAAALEVEGAERERWVAVVLGEDNLQAQAFHVDRPTHLARGLHLHRVDGVGHMALARRACAMAGLDGPIDRCWADAALDFAEELEQTSEQPVRWRGPVHHSQQAPTVMLHEFMAWPEVARAEEALASLITAASAEANGPCRLILGGIAAAWPIGRYRRSKRSGQVSAEGALIAGRGLVAAGAAAIGRRALHVVIDTGQKRSDALATTVTPATRLPSALTGRHQDRRSQVPPWRRYVQPQAGSEDES